SNVLLSAEDDRRSPHQMVVLAKAQRQPNPKAVGSLVGADPPSQRPRSGTHTMKRPIKGSKKGPAHWPTAQRYHPAIQRICEALRAGDPVGPQPRLVEQPHDAHMRHVEVRLVIRLQKRDRTDKPPSRPQHASNFPDS